MPALATTITAAAHANRLPEECACVHLVSVMLRRRLHLLSGIRGGGIRQPAALSVEGAQFGPEGTAGPTTATATASASEAATA